MVTSETWNAAEGFQEDNTPAWRALFLTSVPASCLPHPAPLSKRVLPTGICYWHLQTISDGPDADRKHHTAGGGGYSRDRDALQL